MKPTTYHGMALFQKGKIIKEMKYLFIISLLCFSMLTARGADADEMLEAYGNLNYAKSLRLARTIPDKPEARLVIALCQLFDPITQDMKGGLAALKNLYNDKSLPLEVWLQGALTYGRVSQLVQARTELYGGLAAEVDTDKVFQEIIGRAPASRAACTALFFNLSDDFDSDNAHKKDNAFTRLEKFCREFKGETKYLSSLHLLADQKYIFIKKDFSAAVRHLERAYVIGIANPRDAEIALFRIGRIYDIKLKNSAMAMKYYRKFMEEYPESGYASAATRFLLQLTSQAGGKPHAQK